MHDKNHKLHYARYKAKFDRLNALRKSIRDKKSSINDLKKKYKVIDDNITKVEGTIKFVSKFSHEKNVKIVVNKLTKMNIKNLKLNKKGCKIKFIRKDNKFEGLKECRKVGKTLKDKKEKQ